MKKVTLNRNGQTHARAREVSELKAGQFQVGQHVMLRITGDCCYHSKEYSEYVVVDIKPCDRFGGGRETVTFERVDKTAALAMPRLRMSAVNTQHEEETTMQGDNNNNTPANAANARRCKVPVIVLPGSAALAYKADVPELPRLTAHVESDSSEGRKKQLFEIYIGDDVHAKGVIYRSKNFAIKMIRGALKGAMSRLGKKRRLTANRAARKAAANEEESK